MDVKYSPLHLFDYNWPGNKVSNLWVIKSENLLKILYDFVEQISL